MKYVPSLLAVALAGSICASAGAQQVTLTPGAPGMLSGSFTQAVNGLFIDTFSFSPASVGGLVSVVLSNVSGPVSFFTASLNDQNFSFFPESGATNFAFNATFASVVPLTLTVFGAVLDSVGQCRRGPALIAARSTSRARCRCRSPKRGRWCWPVSVRSASRAAGASHVAAEPGVRRCRALAGRAIFRGGSAARSRRLNAHLWPAMRFAPRGLFLVRLGRDADRRRLPSLSSRR